MTIVPVPSGFEEFRAQARRYLALNAPPSTLNFTGGEGTLFTTGKLFQTEQEPVNLTLRISPKRLQWMRQISLYRKGDTWDLLYRLLWKLKNNPDSLGNPADSDVIDAERRAKQVSRDIHKMHAFVRFQKTEVQGEEYFVAWHSPQHKTLRAGVPFFKRRFGSMRWSILTPDESAHWDLERLTYSEGVKDQPSFTDDFEAQWLAYYSAIFNPARIKINAMKREMPVRYWQSMPETRLIGDLLAQAPARIEKMREAAQPRAVVSEHRNLEELKQACVECRSCPIACLGGRAVFGEGPADAKVVFVGEQPGDEEDMHGRPFIGPAGRLLDEIMNECGVERAAIYVTNAVKHFKWEPRGKRRLHQTPNGAEILACKPWLHAELEYVRPSLIVCLGSTAAQAILGQKISVNSAMEQDFVGPNGARVMVTYHPSAALRAPTADGKATIIEGMRRTMRRIVGIQSGRP